ncbi:MAG TPA: LysR family transcriptional regulator [Pseudothermotoga sp.]
MDRLRTFYFVAKLKSFTKAAEALALTQPAVSIQIKSLEQEYGTILFERAGREIVLTEAGKILFSHVERIFSELERAESRLREYSDPLRGTVSFGSSILCSTYLIPPILGKFRQLYPSVRFSLKVRYAEEVLKFIIENEIDFGIMGEGNKVNNEVFEVRQLLEDELVFVMPSSHNIDKNEVTLEEIIDENFIFPEEHSALRKYLNQKMDELGVSVKPYIEVGNIEVVKKFVEQNFGCSILSYISVKEEINSGKLAMRRIKSPFFRRKIILVKKRGRTLPPSAEFFIDFMNKEIEHNKESYELRL